MSLGANRSGRPVLIFLCFTLGLLATQGEGARQDGKTGAQEAGLGTTGAPLLLVSVASKACFLCVLLFWHIYAGLQIYLLKLGVGKQDVIIMLKFPDVVRITVLNKRDVVSYVYISPKRY